MPFVKALRASEVPTEGTAKALVGGREIAIVNRGGGYYALDGTCTHEGGPLAEGSVEGDMLVCPWHEGRFSIATGEADPETDWVTDVRAYPVKVEDGYIWVDV